MNFRHAEPAASATTIEFPSEKLPPQVLVVDDTNEVRSFLTAALRRSGYRVLEAEDGLIAQILLMSEHPALVISDLEMPVCDGWDLLTHCHTQYPGMPVLLISGNSPGKRPEIERWAAGLLRKPFDVVQLRTEVQRLVRRAA